MVIMDFFRVEHRRDAAHVTCRWCVRDAFDFDPEQQDPPHVEGCIVGALIDRYRREGYSDAVYADHLSVLRALNASERSGPSTVTH